jgi:hypothetical protein
VPGHPLLLCSAQVYRHPAVFVHTVVLQSVGCSFDLLSFCHSARGGVAACAWAYSWGGSFFDSLFCPMQQSETGFFINGWLSGVGHVWRLY